MARDVAAPLHPPSVMMAAHSTPDLQSPPGAKGSVYSYLHHQSGLHFAPVVHPPPPPTHWEQQQQHHLHSHHHHHHHHHSHQEQQWARIDAGSPPPAPPVRDASSLKGVKYGPGHEKFPSWPTSPEADPTPIVRAAPGGGSQRSKSWTDHTNYPKENGIPYSRPYMKRPNPAFAQQQLKTVLERCEKIHADSYDPRTAEALSHDGQARLYLPRVDREGKLLGDTDYMVPSPPERDVISTKPHLTQADLEEYAKSLSTSYRDPHLTKVELEEYALSYQEPKPAHLTQADLEEYSRSYDETLRPQHQQQPSYAQSEGYHSYVSSTDSTMATPFMDRLRRDSEAARAVPGPQTGSWCDERDDTERAGRDSVVTTSSGSASSSETLKWHGSMSDVSVTSSSYHHHQGSSRQLIAHSAKVQSPQRHNSESVLFPSVGNGWQTRVQRNNHHNKLRLFPVNTYTVQPEPPRALPVSPTSPQLSVAERISELERQQSRYSYLDPDKRLRVSDPTLKAIQKKALLSFYERHHSPGSTNRSQAWRSEPLLAPPTLTLAPPPLPPQPPPRPRGNPASRRASSASDYAGNWREKTLVRQEKVKEPGNIKDGPRHQHSNSCGSLATEALGPLIMGPTISLDDWVPERPPKKAHLRVAFPAALVDRLPSPDLPPPSPPPVMEDEVFAFDEPLPPPPPEVHSDWTQPSLEPRDNIVSDSRSVGNGIENGLSNQRRIASDRRSPPVHRDNIVRTPESDNQSVLGNGIENGLLNQRRIVSDRKSPPTSPSKSPVSPNKFPTCTTQTAASPSKSSPLSPSNRNVNQTFARTLSMKRSENEPRHDCGVPAMKLNDSSNWSALRYQTQKLMINGKVATSLPVHAGDGPQPARARLQRVPSERQNGGTNGARLRMANIRDSFRSQKARSCVPRPDPGQDPEPTGQDQEPTEPIDGELGNGMTSTSKASYLAYMRDSHREHSLPNFEGSYKRTMSPSEPPIDMNHTTRQLDCDRLPSVANANVPIVVTEKLIPSHHTIPLPVLIREQTVIIPTPVIDEEKPSVKPSNDTIVIQRVSSDSTKQSSHLELSSKNKEQLSSLNKERLSSPNKERLSSPNKERLSSPNKEQLSSPNKEQLSSLNKERLSSQNKEQLSSPNKERLLPTTDDPLSNGDARVTSACIQTQCDIQTSELPSEQSVAATECGTTLAVESSDVVLLVGGSATSDASSQTEREALKSDVLVVAAPPTLVRHKLQEEIECERLSLDLASQLSPSDKLQGILVSGVEYKKSTDYVSGLYRLDIGPRPRGSSLKSQSSTGSDSASVTSDEQSPLPASSVYFTTSESKAKFLTRYSNDTSQSEEIDNITSIRDNRDLHKKKEELMARLDRKLVVLRAEHLELTEESRINEMLGESVSAQVSCLARPHEAAKYRLHVEEVGKITSLLLGLSGRLARVENVLVGLPDHHSERKTMESKRDKLQDQLEEAKKLKENIDRRSVFVSNILCKYFNSEEYTDYDHFINMKAKLIMDSREIIDKIKLGEEQLVALKETLSS